MLDNINMRPLYYLLIVTLSCSFITSVWKRNAKKSDQDPENIAKDQIAEEEYAALCEDGETLSVVCRGNRYRKKDEYYILTNRRLIIDGKKGIHLIPLDTIKKVNFYRINGDKVKDPSSCQMMKIRADKKYTLYRISEKFDQIAAYFFDRQ